MPGKDRPGARRKRSPEAGEAISAMSKTIKAGYIVEHYDEAVGDGVKGYAEYLRCLETLEKDLDIISKTK